MHSHLNQNCANVPALIDDVDDIDNIIRRLKARGWPSWGQSFLPSQISTILCSFPVKLWPGSSDSLTPFRWDGEPLAKSRRRGARLRHAPLCQPIISFSVPPAHQGDSLKTTFLNLYQKWSCT